MPGLDGASPDNGENLGKQVSVLGGLGLGGSQPLVAAAAWRQVYRNIAPVLSTYITALTTSRIFTLRLLPPRLADGIRGSINCHSVSVRSLG